MLYLLSADMYRPFITSYFQQDMDELYVFVYEHLLGNI